MTDFDKWADGLTVVGDEAFMPGEHAPRPWHPLTDAEREHYKRDWARRSRAEKREEAYRAGAAVRIVGSLHPLACKGRTRETGCVCRDRMYVIRRAA